MILATPFFYYDKFSFLELYTNAKFICFSKIQHSLACLMFFHCFSFFNHYLALSSISILLNSVFKNFSFLFFLVSSNSCILACHQLCFICNLVCRLGKHLFIFYFLYYFKKNILFKIYLIFHLNLCWNSILHSAIFQDSFLMHFDILVSLEISSLYFCYIYLEILNCSLKIYLRNFKRIFFNFWL